MNQRPDQRAVHNVPAPTIIDGTGLNRALLALNVDPGIAFGACLFLAKLETREARISVLAACLPGDDPLQREWRASRLLEAHGYLPVNL